MEQEQLIRICFDSHVKERGAIKFTLDEYRSFWIAHKVGNVYTLTNRDGSTHLCKVAYYPLPYYDDLRALIEIDKGDYNDFREVPIRFLTLVNVTGS